MWLIAIAANLISSGRYLDVAVRDLVMPVGAFGLARLETVGGSLEEHSSTPPRAFLGMVKVRDEAQMDIHLEGAGG